MKITIKGDVKEIAAFVQELQKRQDGVKEAYRPTTRIIRENGKLTRVPLIP